MKWERQNTAYDGNKNPNYRGGHLVPCAHCGKQVYRMPCELERCKNTFCSQACHNEFRRKPKEEKPPHEGKNHWRWSGPKFCKFCGKELFGYAPRRRGYCSDKCAEEAKAANRKNRPQGSIHPSWKGGPVTLSCAVCGANFQVPQRRANKAKYCSYACMHMGQRHRETFTCEYCGKSLEVPKSRAENQEKRGSPVRFCSVACKFAFHGQSSLEIAVADALQRASFSFDEQYQLPDKAWLYDFYLPDLDLLIEADGDFYHYSEWALEQGQAERDSEKEQYARSLGYRFLRIRESKLQKAGADKVIRTLVWPIKAQCVALNQLAG